MYAQVEKRKENKSRAAANEIAQKQSGGESTFPFVDNRSEAIVQRSLQKMENNNSKFRQKTEDASTLNIIDNRYKTVQYKIISNMTKSLVFSPIQMKNLAQTGIMPSNIECPGKRKILDSGAGSEVNQGNVYVQSFETADEDNRAAAIVKTAKFAGDLGNNVNSWGKRQGFQNSSKQYTKKNADLDKETVNTIDPFFHLVNVDYGDNFMSTWYQHTPGFDGYVESFFDSSRGDFEGNSMFESKKDKKQAEQSPVNGVAGRGPNLYHNQHKEVEGNLLGQSNGKTEDSLDSFTKLAGEGARWICIRNHIGDLQDNSFFFIEHPSDSNKVVGVTFRSLWVSWKSTFEKQYNIPDAVVASSIRSGKRFEGAGIQEKDKSKLAVIDYDLTRRAMYAEYHGQEARMPQDWEPYNEEDTVDYGYRDALRHGFV